MPTETIKMKTINLKKILSLLPALFVTSNLYSHSVQAADFTFNVPLKLKYIDKKAKSVMVHCFVTKLPLGTSGSSGSSGVIGRAHKWVNIPNSGDINKIVTISFDARPNKNRTDAKWYKCYLASRQGHNMHYSSNPQNAYFQEAYRRDPKKPFVHEVSGVIR